MSHFSITSKVNRTISFEGKEYLHFSGTAYLGMGVLREFEEMVLEGVVQYGSNYGASRSSNVQLKVYEEMEAFFARQAEAEKAVVTSSGFMAGHLAVTVLKTMADEIWAAPDTHPAILPDGIEPDATETFGRFSQRCVEESHRLEGKTIAMFANALDPLKPEIHSYDWVKDLSEKNMYYLLLDDSHAFGLTGKGIFGTYAQWRHLPVQLIISGSLGKALSIPAGIILGPEAFVQKTVAHPKFIGASPPSPGFCQAFLNAQRLYSLQQEKLRQNCGYFLSRIQGLEGLKYEKGFPVIAFDQPGWAARLREKQVLISSFPYPESTGPSLDRVILSAYHKLEDLEAVSNIIHKFIVPPPPSR